MAHILETGTAFEIKFTSREVSAWGGMALMKFMLDSMNFQKAALQWDLPRPGSNRDYPPVQLIEQLLVSIWCGACRFTHLDITRLDRTLTRLFGWTRVAGHKAIVRLFERFDMMRHERVQASVYRWLFDTVSTLPGVTVDMGSTAIIRHGEQQGAARGYNPNKRERPSHHPLLAFVADARMVANLWLRRKRERNGLSGTRIETSVPHVPLSATPFRIFLPSFTTLMCRGPRIMLRVA